MNHTAEHDYRAMTPHELCVECRAPATSACPRCAAPVCARHQPFRRRRCARCETEFVNKTPDEDRLLNILTWAWLLAMVGLVMVGPFSEVVVWASPVIVLVGSALLARALRVRFLLERKRPVAQLMDKPSDTEKPDATAE